MAMLIYMEMKLSLDEQNRHVHIPFLLRKLVDKELQWLWDDDVIEPVEG